MTTMNKKNMVKMAVVVLTWPLWVLGMSDRDSSAIRAAKRGGLKAFGLDHQALGVADVTFDADNKSLTIANIGSSGQDGVSIDLGGSGGWRGEFDSYDLPSEGTYVAADFMATIDGIPDRLMAVTKVENYGSEIAVSADFSALGSTYSIVSAYGENGELVSTFEIANNEPIPVMYPEICPPPSVWTQMCGYVGGMVCENPPTWGMVWKCTNVCGPSIDVGGGQNTNITAMTVSAGEPIPFVWDLTDVNIRASSVGPLTVLSEGIQFEPAGPYHSALGDVELQAASGNLTLANIGSSGQDGVSIDLGEVGGWDAAWEPVDDPALPVGAELAVTLTARVDGLEDSPVAKMRSILEADAIVSLHTDFTAIGASLLRYDFMLEGSVVATVVGQPYDEPVSIITGGINRDAHYSIIGTGEACYDPIYPCLFAGYTYSGGGLGGGATALIGGQVLFVDEIRAYPEDAQVDLVDGRLSVDILATDIPAITMTSSSTTPLPQIPCLGDANTDLMVDPLDYGFVLARFGCDVGVGDEDCDASDTNGDGLVDPLDAGFVLARLGPCPCK